MPRYVDAELAKDMIYSNVLPSEERNDAMYAIDLVPTADVQEVKHGEWLDNGANYKCSKCGTVESYSFYRYCRWCGAIMDGKDDKKAEGGDQ